MVNETTKPTLADLAKKTHRLQQQDSSRLDDLERVVAAIIRKDRRTARSELHDYEKHWGEIIE